METIEIEKSQFKKRINKLSCTLIKYNVIVILLNVIFISRILIQNFHKTEAEQAALVEKLSVSGVIMIVSVCFGMLLIAYYCKKQSLVDDILATNKIMNRSSFIKILFCFIALQPVFSVIASSTAISVTFSMLLYAAFLGPIVEEIIFRGAVLQTLKQYGKGFAIIVSALLFGDILIGLVLVIFFIGGGLVVCRHRTDIMDYIKENKCDRTLLKYTFSSLWFVMLILIQLWVAMSSVEKLI